MARGREPDPCDSSTWRRYVDKCGDEWFEISPGFVVLGDRESLEYLVWFRLGEDGDLILGSGPLADVQDLYGLRPA